MGLPPPHGRFVKRVILPDNPHGVRSHRITTLTTTTTTSNTDKHIPPSRTATNQYLWGGCRSGFVFCVEHLEESETKREEKEETVVQNLQICHYSQLIEGGGGVSAMVGARGGGLVWVGYEHGGLTVWRREEEGAKVAGRVSFSSPLLNYGSDIMRRFFSFSLLFFLSLTISFLLSALNFRFNDPTLTLRSGVLCWGSGGGPGGRRSAVVDGGGGMMPMREVEEVREVVGTRKGRVGIVLVRKEGARETMAEEGVGGSGVSPVFEVEWEVGKKWLSLLEFVVFSYKGGEEKGRRGVLERVGMVELGGRVLGLIMIEGKIWSFDETNKVFFLFKILFCGRLN